MPRATTSCSAIALSLLVGTAPLAQSTQSSQLALFPVQTVWNQPLDTVVATPPVFAGHRGFVPVEGGQIAAYDIEAGVEIWTAAARPASMPAAGDGLLYFDEADALTALKQETGAVAWRRPFAGKLAVPLVADNGWLIGADLSGTVLAFRAADGELIWRQELGVPVHAAPALAADRVYVALEDGRVVALDVSTGARHWERRLEGPPNDMLALDDRIYVGSDDNFLYCLLASNGEVAWRWRTGGDVIGVPIVDEHRVYFVSKDNVLRGLDRRSGSQRWQRPLPARPTRGLVQAGDRLLVSGLSPRVSAFAMKDGTPAGDINAPGELAAAPYVTDWHGIPQVVLVARDIAKGTRIVAVRRVVDPPMNSRLPVLPNPIVIGKPDRESGKDEPPARGDAPRTPVRTSPEPVREPGPARVR